MASGLRRTESRLRSLKSAPSEILMDLKQKILAQTNIFGLVMVFRVFRTA